MKARCRLFGVVLAGGRSRRFGSPKASARVAGLTLLERALGILRKAGLETGIIANRAEDLPPLAGEGAGSRKPAANRGALPDPPSPRPRAGATLSGIPVRADLRPDAGPLGGLHAALCWAAERGDSGVFLLGVDLPLVPPALVTHLSRSFHPERPTVPASSGPLGIEPLCACYPVGLLPALEERMAAGRFGTGEFVRAANPVVVTPDQLAAVTGLEHAFFNVNTPADGARAGRLLDLQTRPD